MEALRVLKRRRSEVLEQLCQLTTEIGDISAELTALAKSLAPTLWTFPAAEDLSWRNR